ncbi:hypothetical protein NDA16_004697 [Ustilago loliicola]|nr:hypothetical protein NDA16_004697 [Ustilago loliicola]
MANKRIPLAPYPYLSDQLEGVVEPTPPTSSDSADDSALSNDPNARDLESSIRILAKTDREIFDNSIRGFVSYIRAYSKHEMSYIFRIADLDLAAVAHAFALIRLPAMPELKARKAAGMTYPEESVDFSAIPYKDKTKEKARLAKMEQERIEKEAKAAEEAKAKAEAEEEESDGDSDSGLSDASSTGARLLGLGGEKKRRKKFGDGITEGAWSAQREKKELRELKREKRARKRTFLKNQAHEFKKQEAAEAEANKAGNASKNKSKGNEEDDGEEEDDWDEEYRKLKKHKKQQRRGAGANRDPFGFGSDTNDNDADDTDEMDGAAAQKDQEPFFVL